MGVMITNRKNIVKKYMQTWFIIDFLSAFPLDLFVPEMELD